ncbi:putative transcriptional regulator YvhJ [Kroppenstedtia guangzhouensis]|uniref:Transcriptional regulator YvhJ n=1 Tax=Kroppenstedtia guangzhouensis TaxID=1274356 RepID=A0ABQ1H1T3_9BACL|nr:putative transcriptional regulator YvhJ [Kroppenstedtia guangzhouensis]
MWLRILTVFMVGIIGVSSYFIYQVWAAAEQSFDPLNRDKSDKRDKEITMEDPFTVLLVGTDVRTADAKDWRSDVLMVAAVNPKKNSIKMLSIPRDTYAAISNSNGVKTKINSAPYYGTRSQVGPMTNTVQTVENFLNIPIDYYVRINFNGFIEAVDAVGGVDVNVPFDFNMRLFYKWYSFKKGPAHLNGHEALAYVRMRKSDPEGDLGRNKRQKEVIQALMNQMTSVKTVTKVDDLLKAVGNNISHNLEMNQMIALQDTYRKIPKDRMETLEINGENSKNNPQGVWYFLVSDQERLRISTILRKQLQLPLETLDGQPYTPPQSQEPEEIDEGTEETTGTSGIN